MANIVGIVLFALIIFVSVCLHEAGHMVTAKAFGMKVSRYFAGFGPTLFSFRRGETEYGLKALPLGGFVKIEGMTAQEEIAPEDEKRAMWRFPLWQRTIVMSAGSLTHFVLGFALLWIMFVFVGIPNPALNDTDKIPAYVTVESCVVPSDDQVDCQPGDPVSPAVQAGLRTNDKITSLDGKPINNYTDLVSAIRAAPAGAHTIGYERDGVAATATVDLVTVKRHPIDNPTGAQTEVSAIGVSFATPPGVPETVTYGPIDSIGQSGKFTGEIFASVGSALKQFPERVPELWHALNGAPRDPNTPISVVGASRLGGETAQHGEWAVFLLIAVSLNFFVGIFNLLPLLPLDGGHIAVAWFERIRSWLYGRIGRRDPGRVDYAKLMPVTYAVILIFGAFTLLTVGADIVNPIRLFP